LGEDGKGVLGVVAWAVGEHAATGETVRTFIKTSLALAPGSPRAMWAIVSAASWVEATRKGEFAQRTHSLVEELLEACGNDAQRVILLRQLYGRIPSPRDLTADEQKLLRSKRPLFMAQGQGVAFIAMLAMTIPYEWSSLRPLMEDVLKEIRADDQSAAVTALVDATYWAVHDREPSSLPPLLGAWLLDQLLVIPDLADVSGMVEWHLRETINRVGPVPVTWLPGALTTRRSLEAKDDVSSRTRALSHDGLFSKYVKHIGSSDVSDSDTMAAIGALVDLVGDEGSVGYHLPEVLTDVDPDGLLVPRAIAERINGASATEDVYRFARIGGAYFVGTKAWREIATSALSVAVKHGPEATRPIFSALAAHGVRTWSSKRGEVPELFISAVREAKAALESEKDEVLRPFWE
jgi:hypothetical protein